MSLNVQSSTFSSGTISTLNTTHIVSGGTAPGFTAGAGAGTGPTISVSGHDTAGQVLVLTGTTPTASATVVTVNFGTAFAAAPFVVI